ncbi:3-hydroxyisobutyrate dehydrogenase/2-hydroxy-3-oxopropionate reductase [Geothermobacter ehrlichii]|uniref:3-hydroxyisobutyrate dehydrogenase/2-hydroxy-3-oxopropionate reductase n=1 Tax=Geothermobacter ehrlichii TaxID=213224 RepID=A0A5D3WQA8_9BACT|nr:NAD(P)-dependent oxidoreductase [Geothermobacter ehrlichii]TYO99989.1 3-hydroxyisobutyrate dehydrogenase/2-hydroxy-3-oxopropionate reductase [Geothermobacter ehrlichii]
MKRIGFLGLGIMGRAMAANLVRAGFQVTVWNRTSAACAPLVELGARQAGSIQEAVRASEVTLAMLADPEASHEVALGADGVVSCLQPGQAYVDMSTVDPDTARAIGDAVTRVGGRFLEAPVSGSRKPAEEGSLVILAAGDEALYREMAAVFDCLGKKSFFLGEVGQGACLKLIVNMTMGGMMTLLAEALALADRCGLDARQVLEALDSGAIANPMFRLKGDRIVEDDHPPHFPLRHMQKDLRLAVSLGDRLGQALHGVATANETFKRALGAGLGDEDFAAVARIISG